MRLPALQPAKQASVTANTKRKANSTGLLQRLRKFLNEGEELNLDAQQHHGSVATRYFVPFSSSDPSVKATHVCVLCEERAGLCSCVLKQD